MMHTAKSAHQDLGIDKTIGQILGSLVLAWTHREEDSAILVTPLVLGTLVATQCGTKNCGHQPVVRSARVLSSTWRTMSARAARLVRFLLGVITCTAFSTRSARLRKLVRRACSEGLRGSALPITPLSSLSTSSAEMRSHFKALRRESGSANPTNPSQVSARGDSARNISRY